jgi:hypothetical protein
MAILEFIDFDWAHRQAAKKVAAKAADEKKQSLLEKAKKLVSGKSGEKSDAEKGEKKADGAEGDAEGEKAEKKAKAPVEKKKGYTAPKGPKGSGPRGGGSHGGSKRKTG